MAKPTPGVWGIDLGQCALKALRLQQIDGKLTATAFDFVEYPKILSQPDADPDQLIREALTQFLSRNNLRGDTVAISVPGQSGLARFVKLPPVEEKKIAEIVKFEAKQQIPFPLDEVVWDFQKIAGGDAVDGFATYDLLKKGGPPEPEAEAAPEEDDTPKGKKRCAVVMDIGTDASNL